MTLAVRLSGALLLLLSGIIAATGRIQKDRRSLETLDGWIRLIREARGQIDCYLSPLDRIFASSEDPFPRRYCAENFADLFRKSGSDLSPGAVRILSAFVKEIGGGDKNEQVKICENAASELSRLRAAESEELPRRARTALTLGISSALGILILLW